MLVNISQSIAEANCSENMNITNFRIIYILSIRLYDICTIHYGYAIYTHTLHNHYLICMKWEWQHSFLFIFPFLHCFPCTNTIKLLMCIECIFSDFSSLFHRIYIARFILFFPSFFPSSFCSCEATRRRSI